MSGLFEELKRRNVFKVGAAYVVLSWLLAQAADLAAETFAAPDWVMKMLVTVLALGFPLAVFFAWAFEMTPEGLKKEKDVDRSQSITQQTGRKLDFVIIAILIMALGYFAFDKFAPSPDQAHDVIPAKAGTHSESSETATANTRENPSEQTKKPSEKSIAVLPFVNMSSDPEQEYFSDGISEEILNALAKVEDLKVAGRTSSFAFKGQNQDLKNIGQALRVAHILEGSVRKAGNQLRITAQLIKVEDGYHMWSETYDRELTDIFAIQDEISNAILIQLKTQLLGGQPIASAQTNPEAYAQYLLAKQRMYERSEASLELAAELLGKAVEIDPGFAAAHAQMGIATILLSEEQYGSLPDSQAYELGKQHLEKALALDGQQAEALAGMGLYYGGQPGGSAEANSWLEKSLESDPTLINASNWLAGNLKATGQIQASLTIREREFARDPLYMPVFNNLVQIYGITGQHEKARQVLDELQPYLHDDANMMLTQGVAHNLDGQWAKAQTAFELAHKKEPRNFVNNGWLCGNFIDTAQYEGCVSLGLKSMSALALSRLGRAEEGLMLGHEAVSNGQSPFWYFQALVENGRYSDLAKFVETRWADLAAFENDWPELDGFGAGTMAFVAEAYARLDNQETFLDALGRARNSNNLQLAQGADNWSLSLIRAHVAVLSNDFESAITLLERAFDQGWILDVNSPTAWPAFRVLNGEPRYESAKAKMLEHFNAERVQLGLEPLTT